jgi:protein dithiol oxidoreductase (disulfide-forming)
MNSVRFFTALFLFFSIGLASLATASTGITEGKDYTILTNPQPTENNDKIEVLEFFWYGCPHCDKLHPHIKTWLKNKPDDVSFRYVPTIFRPNWVSGAKIFYTIEAIQETEILHDKVYDAIHRDKIDLNKEPILFDWVEKQGIEREKFEKTYHSFSVQNQVARSTQMSRQYELTGTPSIVVDGKYLTSGSMGGSPENTIKILEKLIEKTRTEKETNN